MVGLDRERVVLEPHREAWQEHFEREVERLESVAGEHFTGFEHVGSTAIDGIPAKPIIDMLGVVDDLDATADLIPALEDHGYEHRPKDDEHERLLFVKGPPANRTHYLKVTEETSRFYRETVAFRDYLREHPEIASEYAELKRDLAAEHAEDRDAYTAAKAEFIEDVLERALDDYTVGQTD